MTHLLAAIDRRATEIRKIVLLVGVIVFTFPIPIQPLRSGLDPSWMAGINWASAQRLVFGRDVMFTYGPLGFALMPVDCAGADWRWVAMAGQMCLYGICWLSVGLVLAHIQAWEDELLFCVCATAALLKEDGGGAVILTVLGFLVVSLRRDSLRLTLLATVLSGCGLFIKFNLGVSCCAAVLAWFLLRASREPWKVAVGKGVAVAGSWVATIVAVNWACGGGWTDLVRFVGYSLRIAADYSSQMATSGPSRTVLYLLALLAILAAYAGSGVVWETKGWSTAALLVLPAFFEYKRAVTRMDFEHWVPGVLGMAGIIAHLLVSNTDALERLFVRWFVGLSVLAGFVMMRYTGVVDLAVLVGVVLGATTLRSCRFLPDRRWNGRVRVWFSGLALTSMLAGVGFLTAASAMPEYPASLELSPGPMNLLKLVHLKSLLAKPRRPHFEIPASMLERIGKETVDGYQTEIATLLMGKLHYQPRFMFQSYQAYSPLLDSLAAKQYAANEAPRFILYSQQSSIDSAHPWMVDPLTWLEIYRWYDLADESPALLLLERRTAPRWHDRLQPGGEFQIEFGERLTVPDDSPARRLLKARIELNVLGKLVRFLFRVMPPTIQVEYRGGTIRQYRLVWLNAASGFLISDLPLDDAANTSFFRGTGGTGVEAVTFLGDPRYFSREIHVAWEDLPDPVQFRSLKVERQ
jgi:hypothetical protein